MPTRLCSCETLPPPRLAAHLPPATSRSCCSNQNGGKLTVSEGQTVAPFDRAAFSLRTNELSQPVHTTYGWHVIQALSPIRPAGPAPFAQVKQAIIQQLRQTSKAARMNAWVTKTEESYAGRILYAPGFRPQPGAVAGSDTLPSGVGG